ncbi:MAG: gliding motility-associated C-terminal domain-containing protein [Bacteroidales bacterium]|nr:gliding motility-associated C-terminal domain-containing protein [Bacteroidales bacterium]
MKKAFCLFIITILIMSIHSYASINVYTNIDTCSVNILPSDTIIYSNNPVQIQLSITTGSDSIRWFPSIGLSNDTISNPIAIVNNTTQYIVEAYYLIDSNLVYNGDFELGNTGFLTQYNYWTSGGFVFGNYMITTNANTVSGGFTPCNNGGKYMVLDGIGTPNTYFFQSTVNVEPNTLYEFSVQSVFLAFTELSSSYYPRLKYYINNQQLGGVDVISNYNCNWHTFKYKWYSGTNTTATLRVVDDNTDGGGNDFAVDNILLKKFCKATDTINIIFAPQTIIDTIDITICENDLPYIYYDSVFTQSGTYFYNFSTNNNVDSTYLIHLNVLEPYINTINATICEGDTYTENGFNQNTQGIYTQELQTINGCDSTIILDLTVVQSYNSNINATICEGETYIENGFNENTAGTFTRNLTSIGGCDSIITLQLQVNNVRDTVIYDTIYSNQAYTHFGFYRTEEGTYFNTYQIGEGCPMNITLYLTVKFIPEVNVWLPNAITPYDVVNTEFGYYTELQYIESVHFEVYNRWGNRIFESTKIGQYWDGTYKGKECQRGLYAWKLKYKTIFEDKLYEKSGNVHLIW